MQQIVDIAGSIPTLVVVTLLMLILKPGFTSIIIALMLTGWTEMSMIARAEVLRLKDREFILAARTLGAGRSYIIFKLLPLDKYLKIGKPPFCIVDTLPLKKSS